MWQLTDTSPEAARVLARVLRDMPFERRWRRMGDMYRTAKVFHATGFLKRNPQATPQEIHEDWLRRTLGDVLYRTLQEARDGTRS